MTTLEARTVCVDLDRTICEACTDYADAQPIAGAREALQQMRSAGWTVVLYTARHFNHWRTTTDWLIRHGFEYDQVVFGKPPARYYVDDRAITFDGDWEDICRRLGPVQ